jgi:hypothetical protein
MGLFTAVGKMLNTSAEVGMWVTIVAAVILVAIIIIVVASIVRKKKNDDFDFAGLDATVYNENAPQEDLSEEKEEFVSLKTDEQFEAAKFKKVVATVNEDIAYEQAQTAESQKENTSSKKSAAKSESKKKQVTENKENDRVIEQKPTKKAGGKWVIEHKKEGEYLSKLGLNQLRIAETEKYAHVTFFFNGGVEAPNDKEDRELIPSPKVATYDLQPEMSAYQVTEKVLEKLDENKRKIKVER